MGRNVEIKAAVTDAASVREKVANLADEGPFVLEQEDVFFNCPRGRLKLRQLGDTGRAELIAYERPDTSGPKESRYVVSPTSDPNGLHSVLSAVLGIAGIVRKHRTLYIIGQTRVHLDCVEGLGDFVELEVVLREEQDVDDGLATARRLMAELGIAESLLIDRAYVDLLQGRPSSS